MAPLPKCLVTSRGVSALVGASKKLSSSAIRPSINSPDQEAMYLNPAAKSRMKLLGCADS